MAGRDATFAVKAPAKLRSCAASGSGDAPCRRGILCKPTSSPKVDQLRSCASRVVSTSPRMTGEAKEDSRREPTEAPKVQALRWILRLAAWVSTRRVLLARLRAFSMFRIRALLILLATLAIVLALPGAVSCPSPPGEIDPLECERWALSAPRLVALALGLIISATLWAVGFIRYTDRWSSRASQQLAARPRSRRREHG